MGTPCDCLCNGCISLQVDYKAKLAFKNIYWLSLRSLVLTVTAHTCSSATATLKGNRENVSTPHEVTLALGGLLVRCWTGNRPQHSELGA